MRRRIRLSLAAFFATLTASTSAVELKGVIQGAAIAADEQTSFINNGTGLLRWDDSGLALQQAIVAVTGELGKSLSAELVLHAYEDGDQQLGFSQALLKWKPLSADSVRLKGRAGVFYPRMSLENSDTGWLSPYSYTPSAINSWLGEELRVAGAELSVFSPGRSRRSPWSWELTGALFAGNDPLGSLLSWRGFAVHDRQSLNHDRVEFAAYPSVIDPQGIWSPSWVEPFREIDQRVGHYFGGHLRHGNSSDVRLYYYDNNADRNATNSQRLYAWDTRFTSLAVRHDISPSLRVMGQWMLGSSDMGPGIVGIGFDSYYLMLSQRWATTRITARYDHWDVNEDDVVPVDPNDSRGEAWTLSVRHDLNRQWQAGVEAVWLDASADNRPSIGLPLSESQQQLSVVLQYRFGD